MGLSALGVDTTNPISIIIIVITKMTMIKTFTWSIEYTLYSSNTPTTVHKHQELREKEAGTEKVG